MALTLPAATARLTRNITDSETQIGRALASMATTLATLSLAQVEVPGAPKGAVQEAMQRLQKAQASLVAAQGDMLRAHGKLSEIGREMMGPEETTCPDNAFTTAASDEDIRAA